MHAAAGFGKEWCCGEKNGRNASSSKPAACRSARTSATRYCLGLRSKTNFALGVARDATEEGSAVVRVVDGAKAGRRRDRLGRLVVVEVTEDRGPGPAVCPPRPSRGSHRGPRSESPAGSRPGRRPRTRDRGACLPGRSAGPSVRISSPRRPKYVARVGVCVLGPALPPCGPYFSVVIAARRGARDACAGSASSRGDATGCAA